ncbi:MAG: F0F1 ATP synthase subunit delta [Chthoniobacterales bacterium]
MKLSREAKRTARQLFDASCVNGHVDPEKSVIIAETILSTRPRFAYGLLKEFTRLTRLELNRHQAVIESATPLDSSSKAQITAALQSRDDQVSISMTLNPALLGGARIRLGSDVWDGSISAKLEKLKTTTIA